VLTINLRTKGGEIRCNPDHIKYIRHKIDTDSVYVHFTDGREFQLDETKESAFEKMRNFDSILVSSDGKIPAAIDLNNLDHSCYSCGNAAPECTCAIHIYRACWRSQINCAALLCIFWKNEMCTRENPHIQPDQKEE